MSTLDLDADGEAAEEPPADTAQKSELEEVKEMTSELWESLPPGLRQTAIWDYGFDGVVGAHAPGTHLVSSFLTETARVPQAVGSRFSVIACAREMASAFSSCGSA